MSLSGNDKKKSNGTDLFKIVNGKCGRCSKVDKTEMVRCFGCKEVFHAINCFLGNVEQAKNLFPSSGFKTNISPAVENKEGAWQKRPGRLLFYCDPCVIRLGEEQTATVDSTTEVLSQKVEGMSKELIDVKSAISQLAAMLKEGKEDAKNEKVKEERKPQWVEKQMNENVKQLVVVENNDDGKEVDQKVLADVCAENGIQVKNSWQLAGAKKGMGVLLKSKKDADKFVQEVEASSLINPTVRRVPTKSPTVNVFDLPHDFDKGELEERIIRQNPILKRIKETSSDEGDSKFMVLKVTPQKKKNIGKYQASIRVSNVMRSAIKNMGDVIAVGINSCNVRDSFYIKRCYNCQAFGHYSSECNNSTVCGHCAGSHETRSGTCNDSIPYGCVNCKGAGEKDFCHPAYSTTCKVHMDRQEKLKKSIPFYQGSNPRKRY